MPKFTGGMCVDTKNYLVFTAGPLRGKRVHIFVAEMILGRPLRDDETVHHRNLDKLDPRPENLKVLGRVDHGHVSNRQKWFVNQKLARIEEAERKAWLEWIESGGDRPDGVVEETAMMFEQAATAAEVEFDPEQLEKE